MRSGQRATWVGIWVDRVPDLEPIVPLDRERDGMLVDGGIGSCRMQLDFVAHEMCVGASCPDQQVAPARMRARLKVPRHIVVLTGQNDSAACSWGKNKEGTLAPSFLKTNHHTIAHSPRELAGKHSPSLS